MQSQFDSLFCIVDLHAITVPENIQPAELKRKVRDVAAVYIACGINADEATIFVQSHVKEHAELAWILNCATPIGWLERMTQFKDKSAKAQSIGMGLFDYPVLMAADILLYDTDVVPVGDDQKQHIELTRDIVGRFNNLYGDGVLKMPEPFIRKEGARIMGLNDPAQKMSKSDPHPHHAIYMLDTPDMVKAKIARAVTDSNATFNPDDMSTGVANLVTIIKVMAGDAGAGIVAGLAGQGYGALKKAATDAVVAGLEPIQQRYHALRGDEAALEAVLERGAERARSLAATKIQQVKDAVGLG
jgi:tryptophanyl-tRNA synthetase